MLSMSAIPIRAARLGREMRVSAVLALPLIAGHVSTGLIGFVDAVLAGRHSANTLAAVAVGSAFWSLAIIVLLGVLLAVPPSVSQLNGAGRRDEVGAVFRQALWLALALALPLFGLLSLMGGLMGTIGIVPEVRPGAAAFLHGIRWGVPALALSMTMRFTSDGLGWTLPAMLLGFGGLIVLAPLGYTLMFGLGPLPELGAEGLGYASAIMLWAQAAIFAAYLWRARRFADIGLFARFDPPHWRSIVNLLRIGLPIGVTVLMEGGLFIGTALVIGRLGELQVAAHQIAINVATLCFMVPFGLAEATTVRVGHAVGARDAQGVRHAALAGYVIVFGTQLVSGGLLLFGNGAIAALYTRDDAVAGLAATLLLYAAAFQFPDGVQVLSAGALRGLKDTRVPMLIATLAYWGLGMPLGIGLAYGAGWGTQGMWCGLILGLSVAAILLSARVRRLVMLGLGTRRRT